MTSKPILAMRKVLSRDWFYRWLVIAMTALVGGIGLSVMRLSVDGYWLGKAFQLLLIAFAAGMVFSALAWRVKSLTYVLSACADFFHSIAQLQAFAAGGIALTYWAAWANFPLMDSLFAHLDVAIGFHPDDVNAWIQQHSIVRTALWIAYASGGMQLPGLLLIHCMKAPGEDSGELVWNFMASLLIVTAISVFLPAAGMPGMIGQHHIDAFLAMRNGAITVLDDSTIAGLVTFPSWHAAMGVIFIYSARTMRWLLTIMVPLNVLLIVATPPCGGHYLVDTIAGMAAASASILLVRKIRRAIGVQDLRSLAHHGVIAASHSR